MDDDFAYDSFLRSLDESELISHINSLSQLSASRNDAIEIDLCRPSNGSAGDAKPSASNVPGTITRKRLLEPIENDLAVSSDPSTNTEPIVSSRILPLACSSTPVEGVGQDVSNKMLSSVSSLTSDPFDDNLDSQLLKLGPATPMSPMNERPVPGNQLALVSSDQKALEDDPGAGLAASMAPWYEAKEGEVADDVDDSFASSGEEMEALNSWHPGLESQCTSSSSKRSSSARISFPDEGENKSLLVNSQDELENTSYATVGPQHGFGDYETYFQNKYCKQQLADRDYIIWEKQRRRDNGETTDIPQFFAGCSVFVNGNTSPSMSTIHRAVILHGGVFLNYLPNKSSATHIICDRLTPRKRIEFKNCRVVKAKWITECVDQQTLLDWKPYRLIDDVEPLQKRLNFQNISPSDSLVHMEPNEYVTAIVSPSRDTLSENDEVVEENFSGTPVAERQGVILDHKHQEMNESALIHVPENTEGSPKDELSQLNVSKPRQAFAQMDAKHPDFLKHFFANSRLHHLSTWKADLKSKFTRLVARGYKPPRRPQAAQTVILHIDFDCFFATASAIKYSHLDIRRDAIAVSHGGKSSDVASCNYVARACGVSNGMWLGRALEKCPNLQVIDYDFEAYEKFSHAFYTYLVSISDFDSIFPVSIDEVLVDATTICHGDDLENNVQSLCSKIRSDIFSLTGCSVSIGASKNVLLAKMAIRKAKPDGQIFFHGNVQSFLDEFDILQLPGVGRSLAHKLAVEILGSSHGSVTIGQVRMLSLHRLIRLLGEKTGTRIFDNCQGKDSTRIELDFDSAEALLGRKTVSVDVNFGIRFNTFEQAEIFLMNLAKELHSRLVDLGACGSFITLRLARRAPGAPVNPPKYLGMGLCNVCSRSSSLGVPTNDWGILGSEMKALFRTLNIPVQELRGIAVSLSKLDDVENVKKGRQQKLTFNQKRANERPSKVSSQEFQFAERITNSESIDWNVFNQLPVEIRRELKSELLRRGIPVSGKERSKSPTKNSPGGKNKIYLQQMFPTQPNGEFKVKRVVESPTKKGRKLRDSPTKKIAERENSKSPTPYDETVSYDEEVLGEIPSSIRNEFIEDLEWQRKNKKLRFVSMRAKIKQKEDYERQICERVIDDEWLELQPRLFQCKSFNGVMNNYHELVSQLRMWVKLTVETEGPHPEDVSVFREYIRDTTLGGSFSRGLNLLNVMEKEIQKQDTVLRLCAHSPSDREHMLVGLADWKRQFNSLKAEFSSLCAKQNVVI